MLFKRFAVFNIFALAISLFVLSAYAHWVNDPGANVIEGDQNKLTSSNGKKQKHVWKSWMIVDDAKDSLGRSALTSKVYQKKEVHNTKHFPQTRGYAYCAVFSKAQLSVGIAKGNYEVHAKARGWLWWRSNKKKKEFTGTVRTSAYRSARRFALDVNPTYSGVHVWGKAYIKNQAGEIDLIMEWL